MAKGQTIADLKIRLQAEGGQEVEYLRKELGQLQKVGKLTEAQLKNQVIAVKSLGKATAGTTNGLKAQIAAFEKIRGNAKNTNNVYRDLTNDIRSLNRELKTQIDLEGGVSGKSGGILGFLQGTKARKLKPSKVKTEDTLSYLLGTQYFGGGKGSERLVGTLDEFTRRLDKLQRGFRELSWDDLEPGDQGYLRQFQLGPGKGGLSKAAFGKTERALRHDALKAGFELDSQGLLNKYQLQALGRQDQSLDITGKPYLDLVTKITGEQQTQNHLLGQVNDRSAEELATQRARTRQIAEQNKLNVTHIKSKIHQDYVRGLELDSRKNRRTSPATMFGMRGRDDSPETKRWKGIDGFFRATSLVADELLGIKGTKLTEDLDRFRFSKGEVSKYWKTGAITGKLFTQRKGDQAKSLTELFRGQALDNLGIPVAPRGLGPSKTSAKRQILGPGMKLLDSDPYGLGGPRQYDKSPLGIGRKVQDLQQDLMALNPENKEWLQVTEEITAAEKELQAIVDKGTKRLKERRQEIGQKVAGKSQNIYGQKLLPAAGGTSAGKMQRDIFLAGGETGFSADQYGPQLSSIQRATESQKDFVKRLQESVKTGKLNINTLTQQKAKLDEIRNGLDPTTVAFKKATQAIATTDEALSRLNNNKFSGKNLGRAAQGILGASFFGGPAGFLGSTLGVGVEALRKGGNLQQGAITGGLVASQVAAPIMNYASGAASYTAQIDKDRIALREITKTQENYEVALKATELATKNLNIPQDQATKGMTRLSAAVLGAGGNIEIAATSYLNILSAIKGTAGGAEDAKSAITAMVQIFSKGRVSAEELSGQLGERFPAAVTEFAKANDLNAASLQKQLKNGEVGLDMLLKFVNSLVKFQDAALEIGESPQEAGARLLIQMNAMKMEVGKVLQGLGADFQELGKELAVLFIPVAKGIAIAAVEIAKVVLKIGQGFAWLLKRIDDLTEAVLVFAGTFTVAFSSAKLIANIGLIADKLLLVQKALKGISIGAFLANFSVKALNVQLLRAVALVRKNPILLGAAGLAAIGTAVYRELTQYDRMASNIADGTTSLVEAQKELDKIESKIKEIKASMGDTTKGMKEGGWMGSIGRLIGKGGGEIDTSDIAKNSQLIALEQAQATIMSAMEAAKEGNKEEFKELMELWTSLQAKMESVKGTGAKVYEGLAGGAKKWIESMKPAVQQIADVTASMFDRMADSLTNFVMTGKLQFKEFARSVIADLSKIIIKQMMLNMLSSFMDGNPLAALFGGGGPKVDKATTKALGEGVTTFYTGGSGTLDYAKGGVFAKNGIVPYAKGGIVDRPTLFPFAKGVGLMGEAGPEAIVPLKRGKDGKLGIAGGSGGSTVVNVSVDAKGTKVEGDTPTASQLGKLIGVAVKAELIKEQRPGGLLSN